MKKTIEVTWTADRGGRQGHCMEIEGEIIDGEREHGSMTASNGEVYRW